MDLVTGGTGLVGSHVLLELLSRDREVRAIHRSGSDRDLVRRILVHYRPDGAALFARIHWVECDLLDVDGLNDAMQGIEDVYHCGAQVSFDPRDTKTLFAINIGGTANVVNTALAAGVKTLVHTSSTGATGTSRNGTPVDEAMPFVNDRSSSPYSVSKYEGELEVQRGLAEGLRAVIVNPSVILGPGDGSRSSLTVIKRLERGSLFYPTGSMGFVDARDVAWAMVELATRGESGERYILSGPAITYRDLFGDIAVAFGHPRPAYPAPAWSLHLAWRVEALRGWILRSRPMITRHTVHSALSHRSYDTSKVRDLLGIEFRSAKEAVNNACDFHRKNKAAQ